MTAVGGWLWTRQNGVGFFNRKLAGGIFYSSWAATYYSKLLFQLQWVNLSLGPVQASCPLMSSLLPLPRKYNNKKKHLSSQTIPFWFLTVTCSVLCHHLSSDLSVIPLGFSFVWGCYFTVFPVLNLLSHSFLVLFTCFPFRNYSLEIYIYLHF